MASALSTLTFILAITSIQAVLNPSRSSLLETNWGGSSSRWTGRLRQSRCVQIPSNLTLCTNVGYHKMRLPNLLEHDSIGEVKDQSGSWVPLMNVGCHPDTQLFLCSLFAPVCLEHPIWPCRSLCKAVKRGCESKMRMYGFPWPDMLRCEQFPEDNDMCIGIQTNHTSGKPKIGTETKSCETCAQPKTWESWMDHMCRSDLVLRGKIESYTKFGLDIKLNLKRKKKFYKKDKKLNKRTARKISVTIKGGNRCDCGELESRSKWQVIMAKKVGGNDYDLTLVSTWDKRDRNFKLALKKVTNGACSRGPEMLADETNLYSYHLPARLTPKNRNKSRKNSGTNSDSHNGRETKLL